MLELSNDMLSSRTSTIEELSMDEIESVGGGIVPVILAAAVFVVLALKYG